MTMHKRIIVFGTRRCRILCIRLSVLTDGNVSVCDMNAGTLRFLMIPGAVEIRKRSGFIRRIWNFWMNAAWKVLRENSLRMRRN